MANFAECVLRTFEKNPEWQDIAYLASQSVYLFQAEVLKFKCLDEADFSQPVTVIGIDTDSPFLDRRLNTPWPEILSGNNKFRNIKIQTNELDYDFTGLTPPQSGFLTRFLFEDWQSIGYRLLGSIWSRLPFASPRGTVLYLTEGSLQKETAFHLALKGYGLLKVTIPAGKQETEVYHDCLGPTDCQAGVRSELMTLALASLTPMLAKSAIVPAAEMLVKRTLETISRYRSALPVARAYMTQLTTTRPKVFLSTMLPTPEAKAFSDVCREHDILVATFQHGVTPEIAQYDEHFGCLDEVISSDILFTFNHEVTQVMNSLKERKSLAITVGMPSDLGRPRKKSSQNGKYPPVWYISTALYTGNVNVGHGMTDTAKASFEVDLIENVFEKLPHQMLYKPYPARRYLDPDPIIEKAKATENISVFEDGDDFRYLVGNARIIITSRPTSTLSWCILSGRPVVYIDLEERPLIEEAKAAFDKGIFVVDGTPEQIFDKLLVLLSKPVSVLEEEYASRSVERNILIERFFGVSNAKAGANATAVLIENNFDRNAILEKYREQSLNISDKNDVTGRQRKHTG
jgi:hypothetical protein